MSADRQRILKDSTQYLSATMLGQGIGLIRSIALPVLFSPAQLGLWNLMGVVIGYGGNAHLGLLHGMNKAIPRLRSQGKMSELEEIRDSVFWLNLILGILAGGSLLIASLAVPKVYVLSLRIVAFVVFLQLIFYYLFSLLRADARFSLLSQVVAGLSILSTVIVVCFALFFDDNLLGALIGLAVSYAIICVYGFSKSHFQFRFHLRLRSIRDALTLGIPLIALGFLNTLFLSIDRWIITSKLGEVTLGHYALGIMMCNLLMVVPASVGSVLYTRILERFAVSKEPAAVRGLLLGPLRALSALMLILSCGAIYTLSLLIQLLLPKYLPSVPIIEILIPGAYFMFIANVGNNYLVAINKQKQLIGMQIGATVLVVVLDFLFLWAGYGVIGIALGTAIGYLIYGLGQVAFSVYHAIGNKIESARFLARLMLPFATMTLAILSARFFIESGTAPVSQIVCSAERLTLVLCVVLSTLWLVNRDGELIAVARQTWLFSRKGR